MPTSANIQRGSVVYDVADPRHHGIVRTLNLSKDCKFVANVQWLEAGWRSDRVPVANLRRVTAETPSQHRVKPGRTAFASDPWCERRIKHGSYDGLAVRWRGGEAWTMTMSGTWLEINAAEVVTRARVMTEEEYLRRFGWTPPLPPHAFGDDATHGWQSPLV